MFVFANTQCLWNHFQSHVDSFELALPHLQPLYLTVLQETFNSLGLGGKHLHAIDTHNTHTHTHTHFIWLTCPGTVWISLEWLRLSQTCLNSLRLPFIHLKWLGVTLLTLLTIFGLVEPFPRLQAYSSSLRPMQANSSNLSDMSLWFAMICPGSTRWHLFVLIWTERD